VEAEPVISDGMQASFYIDPAEGVVGDLLVLVGMGLLPRASLSAAA
jgi:hypothetical protein